MTAEVFHEPLPGGMAWVIGGGTRTEVKLRRPWQQPLDLLVRPESCPFCTKPQNEIQLEGIPKDWRLLPNSFTPYSRHRLAIPVHCLEAWKLARLGGPKGIEDALTLSRLAIAEDRGVEMAVFAHIGANAGQNLGHLHWHICEALVRQPFSGYVLREERVVRSFLSATIVAEGSRSGECLIVPTAEGFEKELPEILSILIELGIARFRDPDSGFPPEFSVSMRFDGDGNIRYVAYCPILNITGVPERVLAPLEGAPITLPWPHEVTAKYLRS